jgi:oligosaccharide repeat unit polymerase
VYFPVYRLKFNQDIITKATALALVGSSAFNFGVLFQIRKKETYGKLLNFNAHTILLFLNAILIFLFMGLIAFGGSSFIQGHFKSTANIPPSLTILFQVTLSLAIICAFYLIKDQKNKISVAIIKINKLVIFIYLLFSLLYIFAGDRGPFIQVTIIFLVALTMFIKPIKLKSFIILALSGMLVLTFIGYARTQHSNDDSVVSFRKGIKYMNLNSFFDIAMDLIVTNRNLYTGYEYVDKYGINYGKGLSFQIFAPFPVLPSVYTELVFNSKPDDLTSGRILTNYSKANYGLGTNLIIDLYMGFGVFGVIFFMFLLGYVVTIFQRKAHFSNNFNYIIAYMIMVSFAIYMPRSYITDPFRPIVWALLIFSVIKGLRLRLIQMFAKDIEN